MPNDKTQTTINTYEVVKKLIGEINPIGSSDVDEARYNNMEEMLTLVDKLLFDINHVARFKDDYMGSRMHAGKRAKKFLKGLEDYCHDQ